MTKKNGWIVYNGALRITKIEDLVASLATEGEKRDMDIQLVRNNELMPIFNSDGQAGLITLIDLKEPDFIIFWDKDIQLARHLESMYYTLYNFRRAIQYCDDKSLMHLELAKHKIKTPKTIVAPFVFHQQKLTGEYYNKVFEELGNTVILKESFGSFGMQVYKLTTPSELKEAVGKIGNNGFIMQEYIESSFGRDVRVNIVGNKVIGAMERSNPNDFRANITIGGAGRPVTLTSWQEELALAAHKALGLDFSGVDLLYGPNDEPIVCEVNSNVNYASFETVTGINFGSEILEHIERSLKYHKTRKEQQKLYADMQKSLGGDFSYEKRLSQTPRSAE